VTLKVATPLPVDGGIPATPATASLFGIVNIPVSFNPGTTVLTNTTPVVWPIANDNNRGNGRQLRAGPSGAVGAFTQIVLKDKCGGCKEFISQVSTTFTVETPLTNGAGPPVGYATTLYAQVQFIPTGCDGAGSPVVVGAPTPISSSGATATGKFDTTFAMTPVTFRTCQSGYFQVVLGTTNTALPISTITTAVAYLIGQGEFTVESECNPCPKKRKLTTLTRCERCECEPCCCEVTIRCDDCGCSPCECGGRRRNDDCCDVCGQCPCECGRRDDDCSECGCNPCECGRRRRRRNDCCDVCGRNPCCCDDR
jgi:hypothetical protein